MDVPRGSILSLVLFSLEISNILKSVLNGSEMLLYVDTFALCIRARFFLTCGETYTIFCTRCTELGL